MEKCKGAFNMKTVILTLLWAIVLLVGVLEMNFLLLGIGVVGLGTLIAGLLMKMSKNKKNRQRRLALTVGLNQYLEKYRFLQMSKRVTIQRNEVLDDFGEARVYYDGELCGTIDDFMKASSFEDAYAKLEAKIEEVSRLGNIVDENHNGIDDRLEKDRKAEYYGLEIRRYMPLFQNPAIVAGLKEVVELLEQIEALELKYPQITPRLRKLYQQYLPLLTNILAQYQVLKDKQATDSEIVVMETKLEKAILLVNEALKTLMASLIAEDVLNMSSDITVLEAVLKRDGLVQEGALGGVKNG